MHCSNDSSAHTFVPWFRRKYLPSCEIGTVRDREKNYFLCTQKILFLIALRIYFSYLFFLFTSFYLSFTFTERILLKVACDYRRFSSNFFFCKCILRCECCFFSNHHNFTYIILRW